jgi:membrane associated rhomboid family serine protease
MLARRPVPLPLRLRYRLNRWRDSIKNFFHSNRTEPPVGRPRICPNCGNLVGSTAKTCFNCGSNVSFSMAAASKSISRFLPQTSPATYGFLTLCCLMYGLSLVLTMRITGANPGGGGLFGLGGIASEVVDKLGASRPWPFDVSQPWLITAIFLHGALLHIGFNMWILMDLGPVIEELYGSARYVFIFVFTGAFGYVVSSFFGNFSVGASGSLLGLIGVLLAITSRRSGLGMQMLRKQLIYWLIYIAVIGFIMRGTDNYAHAGGLVSGFLLGKILPDRQPSGMSEQRTAQILGWGAGIAVAVSFGFMLLGYFDH